MAATKAGARAPTTTRSMVCFSASRFAATCAFRRNVFVQAPILAGSIMAASAHGAPAQDLVGTRARIKSGSAEAKARFDLHLASFILARALCPGRDKDAYFFCKERGAWAMWDAMPQTPAESDAEDGCEHVTVRFAAVRDRLLSEFSPCLRNFRVRWRRVLRSQQPTSALTTK